MRKFRAWLLTAAAAAGLMGASTARASVSYAYTTYVTPSGVSTPVTSYNDTLNAPLTLPVYFFEGLSGSSSLINGDGGVFGGGFSVKQSTAGTGMISGIGDSVSSNGNTFAGGTATPNPSNTSSYVQLYEYESLSAISGIDTNSNSQLQMGSVTITPTAPGTYTFILDSYAYPSSNLNDTQTYTDGYDLDVTNSSPAYTGAIANPDTFTVVVTPEPTTLGIAAIAALGLLSRRRSRNI